jgi:hypothetical protein
LFSRTGSRKRGRERNDVVAERERERRRSCRRELVVVVAMVMTFCRASSLLELEADPPWVGEGGARAFPLHSARA